MGRAALLAEGWRSAALPAIACAANGALPTGAAHARPEGWGVQQQRGWSSLANGQLLAAAEQAGIELLITTDQNLRYQQNLTGRSISIVVLMSTSWPRIQGKLEAIRLILDDAARRREAPSAPAWLLSRDPGIRAWSPCIATWHGVHPGRAKRSAVLSACSLGPRGIPSGPILANQRRHVVCLTLSHLSGSNQLPAKLPHFVR
jgi:hypothetical protein